MKGTIEGISHYCQGIWVAGARLDCSEPVHNVKLQKNGPKKGKP